MSEQVMGRLPGVIFPSDTGPRNSTTLQAVLTALGTQPATLVLDAGEWAISADLTLPSTITVVMLQGARFYVGSGFTLTLDCNFQAGVETKFTSDGGGTVTHTAVAGESVGTETAVVADDVVVANRLLTLTLSSGLTGTPGTRYTITRAEDETFTAVLVSSVDETYTFLWDTPQTYEPTAHTDFTTAEILVERSGTARFPFRIAEWADTSLFASFDIGEGYLEHGDVDISQYIATEAQITSGVSNQLAVSPFGLYNAVFRAAQLPNHDNLNGVQANQHRRIHVSSGIPSGGQDGDIWFQYA